jgi:hypothetical protein
MKLTDKQKEILQALVEGKEVEYHDVCDWHPLTSLADVENYSDKELRIKPEVPEDIIVTEFKKYLPKLEDAYNTHNVEYTYDGMTHELKSVRLIDAKVSTDSKPQPDSDGWISNVGNKTYRWPEGYGVANETPIETVHRNGNINKEPAELWNIAWCETDYKDYDIIKFRILKDQNE